MTQSAEVAEDTDCISAEGQDSLTECPRYDSKQSDDEASVMLEILGMQSTPLLPLFPGTRRPGVIAPNMGPISGLSRTKQRTYAKLNCLK